MTAPIRQIHLIFKTHLDVGFTDFAANVVANYFHQYIPKAIRLAETQRQSGSTDRFIWTTGAWLIYEYLEQAGSEDRKRMETAIQNGDIAWHALPFTVHSEAMDASLFRFGLTLSQELDRRFGKQTIAAKMTDVPGHTRGIVPLLAEAGVQFLHIGVNAASTPPAVPPVFVWRDPPSGAEIIVMYHKGSYGDLMVVPGLDEAIAFAHTGDNLGPQSPEQLGKTYQAMRRRFPGAALSASTMDDFARKLLTTKDSLPVVIQEIGDTWIHGIGSDPKKVSQFRTLLRFRRELLASGVDPETLKPFSRRLLLVPEHTWGLDVKTHLHDWTNWRTSDFQAARPGENYRKMEASWQEQRDYLADAISSLPDETKRRAEAELKKIAPCEPDTSGYEEIAHPYDIAIQTNLIDARKTFNLGPDGYVHEEGLSSVRYQSAPLGNLIGYFWYVAHSAEEYSRFHRNYNVNERTTHEWSIPDFTKPGLVTGPYRHFVPFLAWAGHRSDDSSEKLLLKLEMPEESWQAYGAPQTIWEAITFSKVKPEIHFDLQWFQKTATRLPESIWFSFNPRIQRARSLEIEKLGGWIAPLDVIRDGNRHLHATGSGVRYRAGKNQVSLESLDAPLLALGRANPLVFDNRQPSLRDGLHFNLYNNLWGTNFRMWYEEDARFRFTLRISEAVA